MSTTLLERPNPLDELHPAPLAPGRARSVLQDLDDEVTEIMGLVEGPRPVPIRERVRRVLRPLPRPVRSMRRVRPRISILRVARPGPASPTEMPRSLTWLPMLHGPVNARLDAAWSLWMNLWDRSMVIQLRYVRARAQEALLDFRIKESALAAKTARTIEYYQGAAWRDYLSVFGEVAGSVRERVGGHLEALDALAQA